MIKIKPFEFTPEYFFNFPKVGQAIRLAVLCCLCQILAMGVFVFDTRETGGVYGFFIIAGFLYSVFLWYVGRRLSFENFNNDELPPLLRTLSVVFMAIKKLSFLGIVWGIFYTLLAFIFIIYGAFGLRTGYSIMVMGIFCALYLLTVFLTSPLRRFLRKSNAVMSDLRNLD